MSPIRRRRAQLSCTECRRRKLACDRESPCARCKHRGKPCVYDAPDRPRAQRDESKVEIAQKPPLAIPIPFQNRRPSGYYTRHSGIRFFAEIPGLMAFIDETLEEWLKPSGVSLQKPKHQNHVQVPLEALLPPRTEMDYLIGFYLEHFEPAIRILDVPTFQREYVKEVRPLALVALLLAMMSCAISSDSSVVADQYRSMPGQWIWTCERWLETRGPKRRQLIDFQVWCLVYLAKRVNNVHKKRHWTETGALVQQAILESLHCDALHHREMQRRIWHVIRELDLQNSCEYGLPTLLYSIPDVTVDDDEQSATFPLRLEISQRLNGLSRHIEYDDVLRYTHQLTQAIPEEPLYARAQLQSYILQIHRPFLKGDHRLSEDICQQISRDIITRTLGLSVHLHIREDFLFAALTLARIALRRQTIEDVQLLERCLPIIEHRFLQSFNGEPWNYVTLYAAILLVKINLGQEDWAEAKCKCAQGFIELRKRRAPGGEAESLDLGDIFDFDFFDTSGGGESAGLSEAESHFWDNRSHP